ncbi:MAG: DUF1127 domain-containing protein [Pseudomonadota bacterium]
MTQAILHLTHSGFRRGLAIMTAVTALFSLARQRRGLRDLSDETLKDIGLTREQAQSEAARPFWDVPNHWMR